MKLLRRRDVLSLGIGLGCAASLARNSFAQEYPSKLVTIVVPVPPGGLVDLVARALGRQLTEAWGQTVVVENKPGGNFQIGLSRVARSEPNGYTLLVAMDAPFVINPHLYAKLNYDPVGDFAPVTGLVRFDLVLAAHPSLPANNVGELIALAKRQSGELNYGSFGIGSTANLYMELFDSMAGIKMVPVQYNGVAPMIADVVAGRVPLMFSSVGQTLPLWKDGKLKVLGVATNDTVHSFPGVPTIGESGLPGFTASAWFGLFAPRGTPPDIVAKINNETRRIAASDAFRDRVLVPTFAAPMTGSPENFGRFIKSESDKWAKLIGEAGIKIE